MSDRVEKPASKTPDTIIGRLHLTKGAQPVIAGRMLSSGEMVEHFGETWRDLTGQRFRVLGRIHDHVCDPRAQCMMGGIIPTMRDVVSVELCRGCRASAANHKTVSCPITPQEMENCLASCGRAEKTCNDKAAGVGAKLQICSKRWSQCKAACDAHGLPDPSC